MIGFGELSAEESAGNIKCGNAASLARVTVCITGVADRRAEPGSRGGCSKIQSFSGRQGAPDRGSWGYRSTYTFERKDEKVREGIKTCQLKKKAK